jgi:hypothetical protein
MTSRLLVRFSNFVHRFIFKCTFVDFTVSLFQFTVSEVEITLFELDSSKGPGLDGVPPLILKNCAFGYVFPLSMLFNRSLSTCIFPDG